MLKFVKLFFVLTVPQTQQVLPLLVLSIGCEFHIGNNYNILALK
jgi:hypothetical protein